MFVNVRPLWDCGYWVINNELFLCCTIIVHTIILQSRFSFLASSDWHQIKRFLLNTKNAILLWDVVLLWKAVIFIIILFVSGSVFWYDNRAFVLENGRVSIRRCTFSISNALLIVKLTDSNCPFIIYCNLILIVLLCLEMWNLWSRPISSIHIELLKGLLRFVLYRYGVSLSLINLFIAKGM